MMGHINLFQATWPSGLNGKYTSYQNKINNAPKCLAYHFQLSVPYIFYLFKLIDRFRIKFREA